MRQYFCSFLRLWKRFYFENNNVRPETWSGRDSDEALSDHSVKQTEQRSMSDLQLLRELVRERLAAAAEEIFEAVKKTIAGYEEEILLSKRERRLLQAAARPGGKRRKHSGS